MITDNSGSERENPLLLLHGLFFSISSNRSFIVPSHRQDSRYHDLCYTSCGALAEMRNSPMCPPQSYISPLVHLSSIFMKQGVCVCVCVRVCVHACVCVCKTFSSGVSIHLVCDWMRLNIEVVHENKINANLAIIKICLVHNFILLFYF